MLAREGGAWSREEPYFPAGPGGRNLAQGRTILSCWPRGGGAWPGGGRSQAQGRTILSWFQVKKVTT